MPRTACNASASLPQHFYTRSFNKWGHGWVEMHLPWDVGLELDSDLHIRPGSAKRPMPGFERLGLGIINTCVEGLQGLGLVVFVMTLWLCAAVEGWLLRIVSSGFEC